MHHSRLGQIIIDTQTDDLDAAADFWTAALGRERRARKPGESDKYATLAMRPDEIAVEVQQVTHPSRVHIDIETDDVEAEVARLEKLGAKRIETIKTWVVMEAPTGHRFCVVRPQHDDFPAGANQWE
ncbi:MAG TPA: VOC family protein [Gammaproteobacteria bacterium]|jgi:predicted enzyme related to lactoylglutathione lyase|nr:VOC family protein [Gammaproteobacteria bacterium]